MANAKQLSLSVVLCTLLDHSQRDANDHKHLVSYSILQNYNLNIKEISRLNDTEKLGKLDVSAHQQLYKV